MVAFPLGGSPGSTFPTPSYFGRAQWLASGKKRNGLHLGGDTITVPLDKVTGATSYEVRDWDGNIVSTGSLAGTENAVSPAAPGGGWPYNWYRIFGIGPTNDAGFGHSYWITNALYAPSDSRLMTMPDGATLSGGPADNTVDMIADNVLGIGPSRLLISDAARPTTGSYTIANQQDAAATAVAYWSSPSVGADSARPRPIICEFPNNGYDVLPLPASGGTYVRAYVKDGTVDASKVFVAIGAGSVSGAKITVCFPDNSTVVETWDNMANAAVAMTRINVGAAGVAPSSYIRVYQYLANFTTAPGSLAATPIGRTSPFTANNGSGSTASYLDAYAIDGTKASTTFVSMSAGTTSGSKIQVFYPNNSTLVETYDNLATNVAAIAAINGVSPRIALYNVYGTVSAPYVANMATPIRMDQNRFNGVGTAVAALYSSGVTHFEGPSNEPDGAGWHGDEVAHQMHVFHDAVKTTAAAKVIGPGTVSITSLSWWHDFLAAGGHIYWDSPSFHAYGMLGRDLNYDRSFATPWVKLLADYGISLAEAFQTESTQSFTPAVGIHHPKNGLNEIRQRLMWEEYGLPKERNVPWYPKSHGFWGYPTWSQNGDGSMQPQAGLERQLFLEIYGQTFQSLVKFGPKYSLMDNLFTGWRFAGASKQTLVLATHSPLPGSTVTINTSATGPLSVRDAWGNVSSVAVSGGQAVISVREIPTYVSLPVAATYSVATCAPAGISIGDPTLLTDLAVLGAATAVLDGVTANGLVGEAWQYVTSAGNPPSTAVLSWATPQTGRYVPIWCGQAWQLTSTMLTFTVDTSNNAGSSYTTRQTVDVSADATSFLAGSDSNNTGCQRETFWKKQRTFFVDLGSSLTINALRIACSATSYGGEPDLACTTAAGGGSGQGDSAQHLSLQRIGFLGAITPGEANIVTAKTIGNH